MKRQESLVLFQVSGNSLGKQAEPPRARKGLPQALPQQREKASRPIGRAAPPALVLPKRPRFLEILTFLIFNLHRSQRMGNGPRAQSVAEQDSS